MVVGAKMDSTVVAWSQRLLPLAFGLVFFGGLVGCRALRFRRRHGFSPIHIPPSNDHSAHAFLARVLVALIAVILTLGALAAVWPAGLETVDWLYAQRSPVLLLPGAALSVLAAWLVWRGQEDMASSWRIGRDAAERPALVTRGLFRFCRNPIYLGLQVALAAFCCLLPGYLSLGLLLLGAMLLHVQARLEEEYLRHRCGEAYEEYCSQVGRFLPFTGREPPPPLRIPQKHHEYCD
jgi:protein-S-isoprenylcysteine O-methyltransferase Ste14